jgi:hypothetical protein
VGKYYMYLRAVDDDKATLHSSKVRSHTPSTMRMSTA